MTPLLSTALAALAGAALLEWLGVPAGALLGAVLGVALVNTVGQLGPAAELPTVGRFLGYALIGWLVGQGVTTQTLAQLRSATVPVVLVVGALMLVGLGLGWVLATTGVMDPVSAYLATSPGALSQMAVVAGATGGDAALVTAVHTARVVALMVAAPLIARVATAVASRG